MSANETAMKAWYVYSLRAMEAVTTEELEWAWVAYCQELDDKGIVPTITNGFIYRWEDKSRWN